MTARARRLAVGFALAVVAAGCGPLPPQAPLRQAQKLNSATGGIAFACGQAYQLTAFGGEHAHGLGALDATAASSARKLRAVARRNPAWIYQGQTVGDIVDAGARKLRGCGLARAASVLEHGKR
jgi:hypothetical protein